jgi:hypothetical protein
MVRVTCAVRIASIAPPGRPPTSGARTVVRGQVAAVRFRRTRLSVASAMLLSSHAGDPDDGGRRNGRKSGTTPTDRLPSQPLLAQT